MNLFSRLLGRKEPNRPAANSVIVTAGTGLGPWQDTLGGFIPRQVNPHLYEALREAIPVLDGAINRLVTVDGIIRVRGGNDKIVQMLERELFEAIPVNDAEGGLQAFYASQGNEVYEQGVSVGEMVMDAKGRELIALRVADSKGIAFSRASDRRLRWWYRPPAHRAGGRADGTDTVESVLRNRHPSANLSGWLSQNGYVELNPAHMVYTVHMPEADNPYGTSLIRSMEFCATILLKIQNATGQSWDRYGSPPYQLTYKVKNRAVASDQAALDRRAKLLADDLAAVMDAKRNGNSADFVRAIGAEDDITIEVIGGQGEALEIEMPARHVLEQIVAKTGLPSWMLGFHWSTAERLAKYQSEVVLQESRTRFERRLRGLRHVVETFLRGRNVTWKPGDWELWQDLPNLQDELQRAQAEFLSAQTELMLSGRLIGRQGQSDPARTPFQRPADEDDDDPEPGKRHHFPGVGKMVTDGEPWAEDDPELPRIETRTIAGLLSRWRKLERDTLAVLGLNGVKAPVAWTWKPEWQQLLEQLMMQAEIDLSASDGDLVRGIMQAWERGAIIAATGLGLEAAIMASREMVAAMMTTRGLQLVRTVLHRTYQEDLLRMLAEGAYNGEAPSIVARALRAAFGSHDYDWERLARSEIAQAQVLGKEDEYKLQGVETYDYVTAGDERVSAICRANEAGSPYLVGQGPLPMRDSHPNCRCTIEANVD